MGNLKKDTLRRCLPIIEMRKLNNISKETALWPRKLSQGFYFFSVCTDDERKDTQQRGIQKRRPYMGGPC